MENKEKQLTVDDVIKYIDDNNLNGLIIGLLFVAAIGAAFTPIMLIDAINRK